MANTPKAKPAAKAAKSSKKKPASARAPAAHTAKHSATRTAVLVLGMHRSGTSFVTRLLSLAGCALPATLIAASPTNPAGHWESRAVQSFNDKVLASIGSRWDDWGTIDPSWFGTPQAAELRVEAQALLVAEFGDAPLFVLKEPRICRLVPFWLEVLQTAGIAVKIVSVLRHPLETAASLERRNAMPFAAGQALWLRYVLDAEKFSRGTVRVFIHYDDLMQDWAGTLARLDGALGDVLPLKSAAIAGEAEAFLAPGLRHHVADDEPARMSPWVASAYGILGQWANSTTPDQSAPDQSAPEHSQLDEINASFGAAAALLAPLAGDWPLPAAQLEPDSQLLGADVLAGLVADLRLNSQSDAEPAGAFGPLIEHLIEELRREAASNGGQVAQIARLREVEAGQKRLLQVRSIEIAQITRLLLAAEAKAEDQDGDTRAAQAARDAALSQLEAAQADLTNAAAAQEQSAQDAAQQLAQLQAQNETLGAEQAAVQQAAEREAAQQAARDAAEKAALAAAQDDLAEAVAQNVIGVQQFACAEASWRADNERNAQTLAKAAADHAAFAAAAAANQSELAAICALIAATPVLSRRAEAKLQTQRIAALRQSGLFDAQTYALTNPDLAEAGIDPAEHYIRFGLVEGRALRPRPVVQALSEPQIAEETDHE